MRGVCWDFFKSRGGFSHKLEAQRLSCFSPKIKDKE